MHQKKLKLGVAFGPNIKLRIPIFSVTIFGEFGIIIPGEVLWFDVPYGYGIEMPVSEKLRIALHSRTFTGAEISANAVMFQILLRY